MPKDCPPGKEINPVTGRCVQMCKPGTVRNSETGRCVKVVAAKQTSVIKKTDSKGVVIKPIGFDQKVTIWKQMLSKQVIDRFHAISGLVANSLLLMYPYIRENLNQEEGITKTKAVEKRLTKLLDAYITWTVIKQEMSLDKNPDATMFVKLVGKDNSVTKKQKVNSMMEFDARQKIEKAAAFALCPLLVQ